MLTTTLFFLLSLSAHAQDKLYKVDSPDSYIIICKDGLVGDVRGTDVSVGNGVEGKIIKTLKSGSYIVRFVDVNRNIHYRPEECGELLTKDKPIPTRKHKRRKHFHH